MSILLLASKLHNYLPEMSHATRRSPRFTIGASVCGVSCDSSSLAYINASSITTIDVLSLATRGSVMLSLIASRLIGITRGWELGTALSYIARLTSRNGSVLVVSQQARRLSSIGVSHLLILLSLARRNLFILEWLEGKISIWRTTISWSGIPLILLGSSRSLGNCLLYKYLVHLHRCISVLLESSKEVRLWGRLRVLRDWTTFGFQQLIYFCVTQAAIRSVLCLRSSFVKLLVVLFAKHFFNWLVEHLDTDTVWRSLSSRRSTSMSILDARLLISQRG